MDSLVRSEEPSEKKVSGKSESGEEEGGDLIFVLLTKATRGAPTESSISN